MGVSRDEIGQNGVIVHYNVLTVRREVRVASSSFVSLSMGVSPREC